MHPAIAAVANVGRLIQRETRETDDPPGRLARLERSLREGNRLIAEKVRSLIAPTASVITISNSSTVREALITAGVRRVYVLESLPGGEGRSMAEALQAKLSDSPGAEKRVRLIPDAAMANVVPLVDCALVGVDSFDRRGSILHKVGTLPLALCCRHFGKPFHAAGHSFKLVEGELGAAPEGDALPEESWFDLTPAEMITRLITEE